MNDKELANAANVLRKDVLEMTTVAGSGHASSCLSCAEIMSVLFFEGMKFDVKNANNPDNDEFILSKGHAAPILYACLKHTGCIKDNLMELRTWKSDLEGHPTPRLKWVKIATGSLGQGLSAGCGMALAGKKQKRDFITYVLLGDSEFAEGQNYEAMQFAAYYKLDNLCGIIDVSGLGQRGDTMLKFDLEGYKKRVEGFGWNTRIVNGHNCYEIRSALEESKLSDKPFMIIAKTVKGRGVSFVEGKYGWHGKSLDGEELKRALREIHAREIPKIKVEIPEKTNWKCENKKIRESSWKIGDMASTREGYGKALARLAEMDSRVIAIDAEVSNSTYSDEVKKKTHERFVEAFIAEQNMISTALGMSKKGMKVFASSFGAFLTRAHDQIRMASISNGDITICGSHAGVSIGQDGASQMGLEDVAMFRSIPESYVFYPSDAVSTEKIVNLCAELKGIKYIRTTRGKTKIIYEKGEKFPVGDFKIAKETKKDDLVLAGAGITLHECLKAHDELKKRKISASVVDIYCVKPFNSKKFIDFIKKHGGQLVVAEDGYAEGGVGEMLSYELKNSGIKIECLNVKKIPHSGKPEELLEKYGIDWKAIARAAEKI